MTNEQTPILSTTSAVPDTVAVANAGAVFTMLRNGEMGMITTLQLYRFLL